MGSRLQPVAAVVGVRTGSLSGQWLVVSERSSCDFHSERASQGPDRTHVFRSWPLHPAYTQVECTPPPVPLNKSTISDFTCVSVRLSGRSVGLVGPDGAVPGAGELVKVQ